MCERITFNCYGFICLSENKKFNFIFMFYRMQGFIAKWTNENKLVVMEKGKMRSQPGRFQVIHQKINV